jgi:hypothetical protein
MIGDAVNGDERRRRDRAAHDVEGMREGRHRRATDGEGDPRRIGEWAGLPIFEDPTIPPGVVEIHRAPPAKVGSEREGWRARLAHVELLLTEGTEIAGERDGAYDSDKIRQALAAVRSMLDLEPSAPPVEYVTAPIGQCGRTLVGRGGDTWDPVCVREGGHEGPCKPHPDLDREPSS